MASPYPPAKADLDMLYQIVLSLKVKDLTSICIANGIVRAGVKAELQARITHRKWPSFFLLFCASVRDDSRRASLVGRLSLGASRWAPL